MLTSATGLSDSVVIALNKTPQRTAGIKRPPCLMPAALFYVPALVTSSSTDYPVRLPELVARFYPVRSQDAEPLP